MRGKMNVCAVIIAAAAAIAVFAAFAQVTPQTAWWDVPPTNTLAEVAAGAGLATTGEVARKLDIVHPIADGGLWVEEENEGGGANISIVDKDWMHEFALWWDPDSGPLMWYADGNNYSEYRFGRPNIEDEVAVLGDIPTNYLHESYEYLTNSQPFVAAVTDIAASEAEKYADEDAKEVSARMDAIARLGRAISDGAVTNLTPGINKQFRAVARVGEDILAFAVNDNTAYRIGAGGVSEIPSPAAGLDYPHYVRQLARGDRYMIAIVREHGMYYSSVTNIDWHHVVGTESIDPTAVAYDWRGGVWWVASYQGIYCAYDNQAVAAWRLSKPGAWRSICFCNGMVVAGAATNDAAVAGLWYAEPRGWDAEWRRSNVTNYEFRAVACNGAEWIAGAYPIIDPSVHGGWIVGPGQPNGIFRSLDGMDWKPVSDEARAYYRFIYGDGVWVGLVAQDGLTPTAVYSDCGGKTWHGVDGLNIYTLSGVYMDGRIVGGSQYDLGVYAMNMTRRFRSDFIYSKSETDAIAGNAEANAVKTADEYADRAAGTALADAVAASKAYTDASISETNAAFVAAVEAASPPVVLPQKWALANVTNASGGAVGAADVGAAGASEVVKLTGDQSISGAKTFNDAAYFNGGLAAPSTIAVYGQDSSARFEVDNIMTGDYVHFGVGDFLDIGFDYTKNGSSYRVDLPERSGVLSVEGWASTYLALNEANTNAVTRAQLCGAIEKASESKPHFAIIDGELHVITITD